MKRRTFNILVIVLLIISIGIGLTALLKPIEPSLVSKIPTVESTTKVTSADKIYENNVSGVVSVLNLRNTTNEEKALNELFGNGQKPDKQVEQSSGSGFIYKKENGYYYAVTNNHVVDSSDKLEVVLNGMNPKKDKPITTQLLGVDKSYDIAVIRFKTSKNLPVLNFSTSKGIKAGDDVYAIGSPYGIDFSGTITSGIVSAPLRQLGDNNLEYIQTDASINPGNSGGPLFDDNGNVIGMNTMKISDSEADNMGFAIPSDEIIKIVKEIEKYTTII